MPEWGPSGSVRGALGNECPYRDQSLLVSETGAGGRGAVLTLCRNRGLPSGGTEITI